MGSRFRIEGLECRVFKIQVSGFEAEDLGVFRGDVRLEAGGYLDHRALREQEGKLMSGRCEAT